MFVASWLLYFKWCFSWKNGRIWNTVQWIDHDRNWKVVQSNLTWNWAWWYSIASLFASRFE